MQLYLERVLEILLNTSEDAEVRTGPEIDVAEYIARLGVIIGFPDDSRMEVRLIVDISTANPLWQYYSFHYMTSERGCIFRYDNSRHYPELPFFPSHKHEGLDEKVIACPQPSVRGMRDEIEAYIKL